MRVRLLAATTLILALGLALAQPAGAISRVKAQKVALAALKASSVKGPVVVFGLPKPLPRRSAVAEAGPGPSHRGKTTVADDGIGQVETYVDTERRLPAGTWLFWMDLAPFAHFEHPSVLLLVNAKGRVVRKQTLAWWPLVNGKAPAFLAPAAYRSGRFRVFAHDVAAPKAAVAAPARETSFWIPLVSGGLAAPPALPNDCMVVVADNVDPNFAGDITQLSATAKTLGIPFESVSSGNDLDKAVTKLANGTPACTDVLIYLDAHGYPATGSNFAHPSAPGNIPESAHAQIALPGTAQYNIVTGTTTTTGNLLDATAVRKVMKAHGNLTFKLAVDACFSGRWTELSDQPNLRVILAASRSDQMSFGFIANGTQLLRAQTNATITNPGGTVNVNVTNTYSAGGFTNAIATGLTSWAATPGANDLAAGLVTAFNGSSTIDASQIVGYTVPGLANFVTQRPHAPPPGVGFDVGVAVTYRHIAPGSSELCVRITTAPPRPGAAVHLRVTGPGVVSGSDQTVTLGGDGTLVVRVPINQYGDYTAGADVTAGPGDTQSGAGQETVSSAQGTCAAP